MKIVSFQSVRPWARFAACAALVCCSAITHAQTAPATPTALRVTSTWSGGVALAWNNNSTFDEFELERSGDGVTFTSYRILGPTTHSDAMLNPATNYTYRLRAVRTGVLSGYSNSVTARTLAVGAPSDLTATAVSSARVELRWQDNSPDETALQVRRSVSGGAEIVVANLTASTTSYADNTAAPSSVYRYVVYAQVAGSWLASNSAEVSTPAAGGTAPSAPTGLAATAGTGPRIELTWADNATNETGFEVERESGGGAFALVATLAPNAISFVDTNVVPGDTYRYRVRARRDALASGYSNIAPATAAGAAPTGWTRSDVGAVASAGSASVTGGTYTVTGSGADIWDGSDEFSYLHRTWSGDGTLVVRAVSIENTHAWAKAGIMLRESLAPNARHVFVAIAGGQAAGVYVRNSTGGATTLVLGTAEAKPMWLMLGRVGNRVQAHYSADGNAWVALGAPVTIDLPAQCYAGLAVTSHADGVLARAVFDNVAFTEASGGGGSTPPPPPATSAWEHSDVGTVGVAGSDDADTGSGTITVRGSGADIWDNGDGFRFLYRKLTGNCVIEARVTSLTRTHDWAKAGVMMRESLAANARNAAVVVTPANVLGAQARTVAGAQTSLTAGPWGLGVSSWLRLVRSGDRFSASYSTDGVTWTLLKEETIAMGAEVCAGVVVTAHDNATLATATFADAHVGQN